MEALVTSTSGVSENFLGAGWQNPGVDILDPTWGLSEEEWTDVSKETVEAVHCCLQGIYIWVARAAGFPKNHKITPLKVLKDISISQSYEHKVSWQSARRTVPTFLTSEGVRNWWQRRTSWSFRWKQRKRFWLRSPNTGFLLTIWLRCGRWERWKLQIKLEF